MAQPAPPILRPLRNNPSCLRCNLGAKAQTVCCPTTRLDLRGGMLLVGEALGATEDETGIPFDGDAGLKLNYLLRRAGLRRKDLSIGNTVRCRPPGNKKPTKTQIDSCYPYLWHDILKLKPKVIIASGSVAYQTLAGELALKPKGEGLKLKGSKRTVSDWRGFPSEQTYKWEAPDGKVIEHSCILVPTFHPAAALRNWELDDVIVFDLRLARLALEGKQTLRWPDTQVEVATTPEAVRQLFGRLRRRERVVVDTETTGLSPHGSDILCIGFCWEAGKAVILPLRSQGNKPFWPSAFFRWIVSQLADLLDGGVAIVGQNVKFDINHLRKLTGVTNYRVDFDTLIAHHVIDENKHHNLTFLCQWYLRWQKYDSALDPYKEQVGKRNVLKAAKVPNEVLWQYCGYDCDGTFQVAEKLRPRIPEGKLDRTFQVELDLTLPLADMEYRGIHADLGRLGQLSAVYRKTCAGLEKKIQGAVMGAVGVMRNAKGESVPVNPRSPAQLVKVFTKLGVKLSRRTAGGQQASVDKHVMAGLALQKDKAGTLARRMTELRRSEKILGTYLDGGKGGFKQHLRGDRWHPNYNIHVARTGRLSADDPPIQTLPRDAALRGMLIPDRPDHLLISVDYDKIELRVMAWLANEHVMIREMEQGIDLHTRMAVTARLMRDPTEEEFARIAPQISKDERAVIGKGINFGIPYGRSAGAIVEANPDKFPADMVYQDRKAKVQRAIDAYFRKYEKIAEYRERQVETMERDGCLRTTLFRRLRRLTGVRWFNSRWGLQTSQRDKDHGHLVREALNFEIQSIASMTLNRRTKVAFDGIKQAKLPGFRMLMSLHDALIFNVHHSCTGEAIVLIKRWLETKLPQDRRHKYEVPLTVEALVQSRWGEEYSEEEGK